MPTAKEAAKKVQKSWESELLRAVDSHHQGLNNILIHRTGDLSAKRRALRQLDHIFITKVRELEHSRDYTLEGQSQLMEESDETTKVPF